MESLNALVAKGVALDYESKLGKTALIVACSEISHSKVCAGNMQV